MPGEYFIERERALLGPRYEELLTPKAEQPARGVTVSALRCTAAEFAQKAGLSLRPSPFCAGAFLADPAFRPGRHPYHHAGAFYSQEPSAAAAAPLLGVRPGMRVLDLCAAPGGKSSQLAAALSGQGLLVCSEYVPARAEVLRSNMERMGAANAVVLSESAENLAAALPAFFDRVLVDAPCSGEGMFRKEPEALRQHSPQLVEQCAALGATLLDAAAALLAPGGELVYSTCTFAPQEDEAQVGAFLARHPEMTLLPALAHAAGPFGHPGEENRCGEHPFDVGLVRRIWPCDGGEGHFIARFQKAGEPRVQLETFCPPTRRLARAEQETRALWQRFAAELFPELAGLPVLVREDKVFLPANFPAGTGLRTLCSGVFAGCAVKGRFVPEHQIAMAFGAACQNAERLTLEDPRTAAWLAGAEIEARTAARGWCAVLVDGFPLGWGKASGGRVKNHYPRALRNTG